MPSYDLWDPLNLLVPYGDLDGLIATHIEEHRKYISGLKISDYQTWIGKQTMTLFEYVIFYAPKTGAKPVILVGRTEVLAKCEDQVKTLAARAIPEDYLDKLDDVVIKVRPF